MVIVMGLSLIVIIGICVALVFWHDYEDGIVGCISLGIMAVPALPMLIGLWHGYDLYYSPLVTAMITGMAIFLLRHAYRAWRFRSPKNVRQKKSREVKQ